MADKGLSKAELRRKAEFEKLQAELKEKGYEYHFLGISVSAANIWSVVLLIAAFAVFGFWYVKVNSARMHAGLLSSFHELRITQLLLLVVGALACIVIHELVHGLSWAVFCKNHLGAIEFGIKWNTLTPYCTCGEPLSRTHYLLGLLMPLFVVGILPTVAAIYINSIVLFYIGVVMIAGAIGDIMSFFKIIQYQEQGECIYYDHPYEVGMVVFEKK